MNNRRAFEVWYITYDGRDVKSLRDLVVSGPGFRGSVSVEHYDVEIYLRETGVLEDDIKPTGEMMDEQS